MKHKNKLCLILVSIIIVFTGCTQKSGTNNQSDQDYQNDITVENATETAKLRSYVKQGFFSASETQADEIINAVIENKELWKGDLEDNEIYYLEFADLNFDGKIEFIVCDTLENNKSRFHSNAYYLDGGRLQKVEIVDNINPMSGFNDDYTAYFDKRNGEYVVIGNNTRIEETYSYDTYYKLIFDGQKITTDYLIAQKNFSTTNQYEGEKQYEHTFYRYDMGEAIEISESEYNSALRDIEENDDWIKIITNPTKDRDIDYDTWKSSRPLDKEALLRDALSRLTYDIYVQKSE